MVTPAQQLAAQRASGGGQNAILQQQRQREYETEVQRVAALNVTIAERNRQIERINNLSPYQILELERLDINRIGKGSDKAVQRLKEMGFSDEMINYAQNKIAPMTVSGFSGKQMTKVYANMKGPNYSETYNKSYVAYIKSGKTPEQAAAAAMDITRMKASSEGWNVSTNLKGVSPHAPQNTITPGQYAKSVTPVMPYTPGLVEFASKLETMSEAEKKNIVTEGYSSSPDYTTAYSKSYAAYIKAGKTPKEAAEAAIDITRMKASSEGWKISTEYKGVSKNIPTKNISTKQFTESQTESLGIFATEKQPTTILGKTVYSIFNIKTGIEDTGKLVGRGIYSTAKAIGKTSLYLTTTQLQYTWMLPEKTRNDYYNTFEFTKPTSEEIKTTYTTAAIVAGTFIPFVNVGMGLYFTYKLGRATVATGYSAFKSPDLATKSQLIGRTIVLSGLTTMVGVPSIGEAISTGKSLFYMGKVKKIIPTMAEQKAVEPFSRQRATVIVRTEKGGYILGKSQSGEIISFGGVANKGETMRHAAYRELWEETGLKGVTLKSAGKVITPEETFHLFTTTVTKKQAASMFARSDIQSIVNIPLWRANMMKGVTGQTAFQPVSRLSLYPFGKIRAYEEGIINYLQTGQQPTWLAADTKMGRFILGTQSRYDVPWVNAKLYEKIGGPQLYAHGTPSPPALQLFWKKYFKVSEEAAQRGSVPGLYLQPPVAPGIIIKKPFRIVYHGTTKSNVEGILSIGLKNKGIVNTDNTIEYIKNLFKKRVSYLTTDKEVAKVFAGKNGVVLQIGLNKNQYNQMIEETLSSGYKTYATKMFSGKYMNINYGNKVYLTTGKISPLQIRRLGEQFTQPSSGYVGLSYMGYGTSQEVAGIKFGYAKPTAYIFREPAGSPMIKTTPKALIGMESERVIPPGAVISTYGVREPAFLGWKTAYFQPAKIVGPGEVITGTTIPISSMQNSVYISPSLPVSILSSEINPSEFKFSYSTLPSSRITIKSLPPVSKLPPSSIFNPSRITPSEIPPSPIPPSPFPPSPIPPSPIPPSEIPPSRISVLEAPPSIPSSIFRSKSDKKSLFGKIKQAYQIIIWKGGKEIKLGKPMPKGKASKRAVKEVLGTLRASFKLEPKGTTAEEDILYNIPTLFKKSKHDINRYVQPKTMRLKARTEIGEILKAQKSNWKMKSGRFKFF